MERLTEEQKKEILNKINLNFCTWNGVDHETHYRNPRTYYYSKNKTDDFNVPVKKPSNIKYHCYCEKNKGEELDMPMCPYCGSVFDKEYGMTLIPPSEYANIKNDPSSYTIKRDENYNCKFDKKLPYLYVCKHSSVENAITIFSFSLRLKRNDDLSDIIDIMEQTATEIIPNQKGTSYTIKGNKEVKTDVLDTLRINSKTKNHTNDIIWENSTGMLDFFSKNEKFAQYTGVLKCFNDIDGEIAKIPFFKTYMALYCIFPPIDQLVKIGRAKLIESLIYNLLYNKATKEDCKLFVSNLRQLINPEAKSSKDSLYIPSFVAEYLLYQNASLDEYNSWGVIFSYNNISKEQFFDIVYSDKYMKLRYFDKTYPMSLISARKYNMLSLLADILKYGYKLSEVINYIFKQNYTDYNKGEFFSDYQLALICFRDYLRMFEEADLEHEKFPSQLKSAHDNIQHIIKYGSTETNDKVIKKIHNKYIDVIPEHEKYFIEIPQSSKDFVTEGEKQHNCVASYISSVVKGDCIIFFIREKDNPNDSFITAECRDNYPVQIMYRNNKVCTNEEIIKFAYDFCKNIGKTR